MLLLAAATNEKPLNPLNTPVYIAPKVAIERQGREAREPGGQVLTDPGNTSVLTVSLRAW